MRTPAPTALCLALFLLPRTALAASDSRIITMSGHGEVKAAPDTATLSAGVSVTAPTAAAALSADNLRMQALMMALKKLDVPDRDIRTENFSVFPQYSDGKDDARRVTGYQVNNQVTVRLEDVTKLGPALDTLVTAGANQINGVNFSIRDDASLLEQARSAAVADAKLKAETFAKAAGVNLGSILSIGESGNAGPRPLFAAPVALRAASVPVAPGEENVSAEVTIVWEIK